MADSTKEDSRKIGHGLLIACDGHMYRALSTFRLQWAALLVGLLMTHNAVFAQISIPPIAVGTMPSYAQLLATYPEGLKEDSKYVLLGMPDLAPSGSFKIRLASELPSTTMMALYVGPSLSGPEWTPVGVFQIGPRLGAGLELQLRNERTQAYMLVAIANDKHYKVVREVKHVLLKPTVGVSAVVDSAK